MYDLISLGLNVVFGGGFVVTFITLRSQKKEAAARAQKAVAEARTDEIQNVESAIKIWREMAESLSGKYDEVSLQVERLTREVTRLTNINSRILKLLDKITPENLQQTIEEIKKEIHDDK